jgi:hypothetical protein
MGTVARTPGVARDNLWGRMVISSNIESQSMKPHLPRNSPVQGTLNKRVILTGFTSNPKKCPAVESLSDTLRAISNNNS